MEIVNIYNLLNLWCINVYKVVKCAIEGSTNSDVSNEKGRKNICMYIYTYIEGVGGGNCNR